MPRQMVYAIHEHKAEIKINDLQLQKLKKQKAKKPLGGVRLFQPYIPELGRELNIKIGWTMMKNFVSDCTLNIWATYLLRTK